MVEGKFDFWQDHSDEYLEMAFKAGSRETALNPDGYGKRTGDCGDTVEIFIFESQGKMEWISYATDGCMNTDACANTVIRMAQGKSIGEGWEITPEHVIEYLKTLQPEKHHCAELTVGAFYRALNDLSTSGNSRANQGQTTS